MQGRTVGGHVFPETLIYAGEIYIRELLGTVLERQHDGATGLYLWK
jgi:predicted DNA-binding protein with PD1-like motif